MSTLIRWKHVQWLRWAVGEAAAWRGSMTGNPDPEPLEQFDACIKECREALKVIDAERRRGSSAP